MRRWTIQIVRNGRWVSIWATDFLSRAEDQAKLYREDIRIVHRNALTEVMAMDVERGFAV
jgi:hypothetical protein